MSVNPSDRIKAKHPIDVYLRKIGVKLIGEGAERKAICPFHKDQNPSLSVNVTDGIWKCHAGCGQGSVIDLMAKVEKRSVVEIIREEHERMKAEATTFSQPVKKPTSAPKGEIECTYSYKDETGEEVFQVVRMRPKTFRQRHREGEDWVWSMENVRRVLYNLPAVMQGQRVWVVEGEKDADTLNNLGYVATCNVGGAGKWLEGYTESLAGKDVILCGDNDAVGQKHIAAVREALAGHVKSTKTIKIPTPHKDVTDLVRWMDDSAKAKAALEDLCSKAATLHGGIEIPVYSIQELEPKYMEHIQNMDRASLHLSQWLPSLSTQLRAIVPGELVMFLADTGVGKTALLSNLALHAAPLSVLFFELELPETLVYERILAMRMKWPSQRVEDAYKSALVTGDRLDDKSFNRINHIYVCTKSRVTIEDIERITLQSELKIGHRPNVLLLDYIQLVTGRGSSRYERISSIAEDLKVLAKSTGTIVVVASQVSRKGDDEGPEVFLHDAKDSGSIENSSGLVIGAWRDEKDRSTLWLQILKNTKGHVGQKIECNFDGASMTITERAKILPPPSFND